MHRCISACVGQRCLNMQYGRQDHLFHACTGCAAHRSVCIGDGRRNVQFLPTQLTPPPSHARRATSFSRASPFPFVSHQHAEQHAKRSILMCARPAARGVERKHQAIKLRTLKCFAETRTRTHERDARNARMRTSSHTHTHASYVCEKETQYVERHFTISLIPMHAASMHGRPKVTEH